MENNQEEFYSKMGAYFWLWHTVRRGMEDSLTHDDLSDQERFEKLGVRRTTINRALSGVRYGGQIGKA